MLGNVFVVAVVPGAPCVAILLSLSLVFVYTQRYSLLKQM